MTSQELELVVSVEGVTEVGRLTSDEQIVFLEDLVFCQHVVLKKKRTPDDEC